MTHGGHLFFVQFSEEIRTFADDIGPEILVIATDADVLASFEVFIFQLSPTNYADLFCIVECLNCAGFGIS